MILAKASAVMISILLDLSRGPSFHSLTSFVLVALPPFLTRHPWLSPFFFLPAFHSLVSFVLVVLGVLHGVGVTMGVLHGAGVGMKAYIAILRLDMV